MTEWRSDRENTNHLLSVRRLSTDFSEKEPSKAAPVTPSLTRTLTPCTGSCGLCEKGKLRPL